MIIPELHGKGEAWLFRERVAGCFGRDGRFAAKYLVGLPAVRWKRHLHWLDASGMALYLLVRLDELGLLDALPDAIRDRLEQNRADNRMRTSSLLADMVSISHDFEAAGVRFANHKGLTLPAEAVPCPDLRCQMDLDFLIAAEHAGMAREALERRGYRLHAMTRDTLEMSTAVSRLPTIEELYKPRPQRAVELHLIARDENPAAAHRLARAGTACIRGEGVRALASADHLLLQALHLFKHLRSDFTRMSWLLEFTRHVAARRDDGEFWREVRESATESAEGLMALGASLLLAAKVFDLRIPEALEPWTVGRLPVQIALWIETYGPRAPLSETPGTKLYLLLEAELAALGERAKPAASQRLVPLRLPRMIVQAVPGDSMASHVARYAQQAQYLIYRMRFHVREGIRYRYERSRWIALKRTLPC